MSADLIERLEAGIRAAHEAGNTEHVRRLGAELRRVQAQTGQQSGQPTQEASSNPFRDLQTAFRANVDPILEGAGTTADVLGREGLAETLRGATEAPENFISPTEQFFNADEDGSLAWRFLPGAIGEQIGQFAGSVASRGIGAAVGGGAGLALGPKGAMGGALAGAFAGPALFEAVQVLGPIAMERARNNGREEPNREDLLWAAGTSAGQGALNAIAPGLSGIVKRALAEGATEGAQSVVQQTGETLETESGLEVDLRQAAGEGIIGTGTAATVDASTAAARRAAEEGREVIGQTAEAADRALGRIRFDDRDFSEAERAAAERLYRNADGDMSVLGNVSDTGDGTAKGVANAALREVRAEADVVIKRLRKLAEARGDDEATSAINAIAKTVTPQGTPTTEALVRRLEAAFPNEADVPRLVRLSREHNVIQDFTAEGFRDMGGLSQWTKNIDLTDKRNSLKIGAYAGLAGGLSLGGLPGAALTMAGQTAANRGARIIDRMTNRRSRVKRFVDSARRKGTDVSPIEGRTARESLEELKKIRKAQKAAQKLQMERAKERAQGQGQPSQGRPLDPSNAQAKQQTQAESLARQYQMESFATEDLFEPGAVVPDNDPNPVVQGHYNWQQATGLAPTDTLDILEQLAREGRVPEDTPQRFRENIRSFSKDPNTPLIQRMVAQRAGSDPERNFTSRRKKPVNPDDVVRKLRATDIAPVGSRKKFKAKEGERIAAELQAKIEAAEDGLSADQYQMLLDLKNSIDTAGMERAARFKLVNEMIPLIFPKRNQKALREMWRKNFSPLAAVGNDYAIERETQAQDPVEDKKEKEFEKKVEKAAKKQRKKKPTGEVQLELDLQPDDKAEAALKKLREGRKAETKPDTSKTAGQEVQDAKEPQPEPVKPERESSRKKKKLFKDRVDDRIDQLEWAIDLAEKNSAAHEEYVRKLPKNGRGRVEGIFYDMANDRMTQNMVTEAYRDKFGVPIEEAARAVDEALAEMESHGLVRRIKPKYSDNLKFDGKTVKGEDGKPLHVVQVLVEDQALKDRLEVAKAIKQVNRMVPQDGEVESFSPNRNKIGAHKALKDPPSGGVDGSFTPIFKFLNQLRASPLAVSTRILDQIEEGIVNTKPDRVGVIGEVLTPPTKAGRNDEGPLRTVAQLFHQLGRQEGRVTNKLYQEWTAGANLRVYSKNGLAHSQAGDLMKGILRTPEKAPVGGEEGLKFLFHSLGNLLGQDKDAPKDRREYIFENDMVDTLLEFAKAPFKRNVMSRDGKTTKIGKMVKEGEGFFQVLNAANEVSDMVNWARERHPDKSKLKPSALLQDPDVRADLARNYETDFLVQLDASNNAYQIVGMLMGDEKVLRKTGMLPPEGVEGDLDEVKGEDIYLEPAKNISRRVREVDALDLPLQKLRKLFKGPIGTYLYAAEFNSRREYFQEILEDIAYPADPFGFTESDLIQIPQAVVDGMKSKDGFTFMSTEYDVEGQVKKEQPVRRKLVKDGKKWKVATAKGSGAFKTGISRYKSEEEAIKEVFSTDLFSRMNRELVREMNVEFPQMNDFLIYARTVGEIMKGRGSKVIKVPTRDGMMLEYSFKQNPVFKEVPVELPSGVTARMGVRTDEFNIAGRGLAAFIAHQTDAWALRETHKRLQDQAPLVGFNPIHDSYGFHPSDATRGQKMWYEVMKELGAEDYNVFLQILEANNISISEFEAAGGDKFFVLGRRGVEADPTPTALS